MMFDEILSQVLVLLQREGRVSYRALKRRFNLDDDFLEDLKDEIIEAKRLALDENGRVLVWTGGPLAAMPPAGDEQAPGASSHEAGSSQRDERAPPEALSIEPDAFKANQR